jgi:hypothetical protein
MTKRTLDYWDSERIVQDAINIVSNQVSISRESILRDVVPTPEMRQALRLQIVRDLNTLRFSVNSDHIVLKPEHTVHDVALSLTGLAGDADVDDE